MGTLKFIAVQLEGRVVQTCNWCLRWEHSCRTKSFSLWDLMLTPGSVRIKINCCISSWYQIVEVVLEKTPRIWCQEAKKSHLLSERF